MIYILECILILGGKEGESRLSLYILLTATYYLRRHFQRVCSTSFMHLNVYLRSLYVIIICSCLIHHQIIQFNLIYTCAVI